MLKTSTLKPRHLIQFDDVPNVTFLIEHIDYAKEIVSGVGLSRSDAYSAQLTFEEIETENWKFIDRVSVNIESIK